MDGKIIYLLNRVLNERMQQLVGFTLAQSSVQHTNLTRHLILAFLVMLFVLMPAFKSLAADEIKIDHPLMSRYQGVNSTTFKQDIFDYIGLDLPVGKIDDRYGNDNVLHVAGKASFITYHLPKQTSQLEVVKTLKLQIKKSKFEVIFECAESDDFKHNSCGKQMYFFAHSKRAANGFQFNCGRKKEYYLVTAILKRADGKSSYLYICVEEGKLNQSIVEEKDFVPNKITIDTANYLPTTQSLTAVKALDKPDTKGAKDHPLISRFPGSYIERYAEIDFMTFNLPTKSLAYDEKLTSKHRLPVSGKGTFIQYHLPDGLSQYQVVENYRQAFEKNNIKILFQCQGEQECGDAFDNKTKDLVGGLKGNPDVAHDCGGGQVGIYFGENAALS